MFSRRAAYILLACTFGLFMTPVLAQRTRLAPGWNLFTTQQDVELGRALAADAEAKLEWSADTVVHEYINTLGHSLAGSASGYRYPFEFRVFKDPTIQSMALPGGIIYVSSGLVLAAQDEPQLAGILAHQIGHVVARHGSQQVSNAYAKRTNTSLRSVSIPEVLSQLNLKPDPGSIALKYDAQAEQEADLVAVQLLHDARFSPEALTSGMRRLSTQPLNATRDFSADHPAPADRATAVRREAQRLGPIPARTIDDSANLRETQANLRAEADSSRNRSAARRSDRPSTRFIIYEGYDFDISHPDNWMVVPTGSTVTIGPDNAIDSGELAYGMLIDTFVPRRDSGFGRNSFAVPGQVGSRSVSLSSAADQLIEELQRTNPELRVIRTVPKQIGGAEALELELNNASPVGGNEVGRLVAVLRPSGVLSYFLAVAPQSEITQYRSTFDRMFSSIRLYN